ncbi:MAG TPA: FecR domain-containing protein [Dinghuibacter sp.]|uniref:FecR family protein n=1 Tax=Dinghuibacter sp. TaxID=2024697 RepID=UPI002BA23088|nr:FecR domain-containing protein [Dinghuibacter sp.]HTJ14171.1 FecR domain-containing protein [Dinghuibacter sp.]
MPTTRLAILFQRYFDKTATPAEVDEFLRLADREEHAAELQTLMEEAWRNQRPATPVFAPEQSSTLLNNVLAAGREEASVADTPRVGVPRVRWLWRAAAAAIAIGIIGGGAWWMQQRHQATPVIARVPPSPVKDVAPGYNRAILILGDGSAVSLDSVRQGKLAQQGQTTVNQIAGGKIAYDAAGRGEAGKGDAGKADAVVYNMVKTPRGGQYQVTLSDGSKVWLNAASSLRFPTAFTGGDRTVALTGEAYFEIAQKQNQPFKVEVGNTIVDVLGTHFDVMAYPEESYQQTTLLEGAVKVSDDAQSVLLKPGEGARISQGQIQTIDADVDQAIAWKNGLFQFDGTPVEEVMHQICRWYDVDVKYGAPIQRHFSGQIERSASLTQVLKMLDMAGKARFSLEGRTVVVN